MSDSSWTWNFEEVLPSVLGAGEAFMGQMLEQLETLGWCERDIFCIRLATEEALANAIRHGNCLDCQKRVHVLCQISPELVHVEIGDEGEGFNPEEVPDPTAPENLERPCGRGVMLMKNFMCHVEYCNLGSRVIMEKRRSRSTSPASDDDCGCQ